MGGSAGQLIAQNINDVLHNAGLSSAYIIPVIIFSALAIFAIGYAWAIRKDEFQYALSMVKYWVTCAALIAFAKVTGFIDWIKHYGDPNYTPSKNILKSKKPIIAKFSKPQTDKILERKEPTVSSPNISSDHVEDTKASNIKVVPPQELSLIHI